MGKEIQISGLENIQPLSDYSGGTVYRGKRMAEFETIIKILPNPVDVSQKDEQNTAFILKEIKKLKHLNLVPNIHVVKILNAGFTENDSCPFIETEWIKGPNLEELLTFPNNAIFRVEEVINLMVQMADALAHVHTANIKHGRINSNNIRLNPETGSYVLLNFGRILLSDEERKAETSIAGEFFAPEQQNGEILFETDIYSLGVIFHQILTGNLPLRNVLKNVAIDSDGVDYSLMKKAITDTRIENLPLGWTDNEKEQEMKIPEWMFEILAVCLQEDPSKRYSNGIKFQEAIKSSLANATDKNSNQTLVLSEEKTENKDVKIIPLETNDLVEKDAEIKRLRALVLQKDGQLDVFRYQSAEYNPDRNKLNISKPIFYIMMVLFMGLAVFAVYGYFFKKSEPRGMMATYSDTEMRDSIGNIESELYADSVAVVDTAALIQSMPPALDSEKNVVQAPTENEDKIEPKNVVNENTLKTTSENKARRQRISKKAFTTAQKPETNSEPDYFEPPVKLNNRYTLDVPKAYFYDKPEAASRRPIYLANTNESELTATKDTNGFIYVVFFNTDREITRGWLRKQDLRQTN